MLKSIYISNYALITSLEIEFEDELTVLTGETGAGKSIILGALSLILGNRADNKSIKIADKKCIVEAVFDISNYKQLHAFFDANALDNDGKTCIVRRELSPNGKSRAFINDTPVSLHMLRELCNCLIDIHSQHENLLLSNTLYQLDVLDTVSQNTEDLVAYRKFYYDWKTKEKLCNELIESAAKASEEADFIRFQFEQLQEAALQESEQALLETEQETLSHVEEIKSELTRIHVLLEDEEAILPRLKETESAFSKISSFIPEGTSYFNRIQSAYIDLKDLQDELFRYQDQLAYNPARLEWVENRLSQLYALQQKFNVRDVSELIAKKNMFDEQLRRIESFDDSIAQASKQVDEAFLSVQKQARLITKSRQEKIPYIEKYMVEQLMLLGMPHVRFKIECVETDTYTERGKDKVVFLFSANKNRALQAVEEIASGGEVSRLMLTVKSLIANKSDLPTIIFDEIDTGVSGEIAHRMGEIMRQMGHHMQVIAITHLPQIAAKGKHHFRVYKDESGSQTETYIQELTDNDRINEIATMLSGARRGEAAIQNAKELLGKS